MNGGCFAAAALRGAEIGGRNAAAVEAARTCAHLRRQHRGECRTLAKRTKRNLEIVLERKRGKQVHLEWRCQWILHELLRGASSRMHATPPAD